MAEDPESDDAVALRMQAEELGGLPPEQPDLRGDAERDDEMRQTLELAWRLQNEEREK